jgi:hypothetical protein
MNDTQPAIDLDAEVQGYLTCDQALSIAHGYMAAGDMMSLLGNPVEAAAYYGRAEGVGQGGCSK